MIKMKNLILLTLFLFAVVSLSAQDLPEIVYLKNGNMIRGTIVQMIPKKSLQIRSGDGNIYVYQMSEVVKIIKNPSNKASTKSEPVVTPIPVVDVATPVSNTRTYSNVYVEPVEEEFIEPAITRPLNSYAIGRGYRGLFDLGYSVSTDVSELDRLELATSQGYQFNPYLFLGVGGGVSYFYDQSSVCFPVFINPRVDFNTGKISPFIDLKGGYTFGEDVEGLYISPSAGARFALTNGGVVNFSVGYTLQEAEVLIDYNSYYMSTIRRNIGAITLKIGFDF